MRTLRKLQTSAKRVVRHAITAERRAVKLRSPQRARSWTVLVAAAVGTLSLTAVIGAWGPHWSFGLPHSATDLARLDAIVPIAAFVVATAAVVIALMAYWQASGLPLLEIDIKLPGDVTNSLFFATDHGKDVQEKWPNLRTQYADGWLSLQCPPMFFPDAPNEEGFQTLTMLQRYTGMTATVQLRNRSKYAARNPGVRIKFDGLLFNNLVGDWRPVERWGQYNGYLAVQWDGGVDNIVHGLWSRALPDLSFVECIVYRLDPPPKLVVTVVADGCEPVSRDFSVNVGNWDV
jgi:hypothetical protein